MFRQDLYDKYDAIGKAKAIEVWNNFYKMKAIENPDRYGIDLLIYDEGEQWAWCEVAVRMNPKYGDCLIVNGRRRKLFNEKLPVFIMSFDFDLSQVDMTTALQVKEHGIVEFGSNSSMYFRLPPKYYRRFCSVHKSSITHPPLPQRGVAPNFVRTCVSPTIPHTRG